MDAGYKGNALEKIEDASSTVDTIIVKLTTNHMTTEELLYWLKKVKADLQNAKHYAGLI